jgi:uncharacterized membrane protein YczE
LPATPWVSIRGTFFTKAFSRTFGLAVGTWAILISFVVLLGWWSLRARPGIGTVANAIVVGAVIDLVLSLVGPPHELSVRYALLVGGVLGNGFATGLYIGAGLGPGPRDGLSTAIAAHGCSMRTVEATVLAVGYLLGGTVGIGTVLYGLTIGPITHRTIPALAVNRRRGTHQTPASTSNPQHKSS